jgi:hypothetical protein
MKFRPIPVTARSEAWVCDFSLVAVADSYSAGVMNVFSLVSVVCYLGRSLCDEQIVRPAESYRVCVGARACVCYLLLSGVTVTIYTYSD